jgi:hypothetical protein
MSQTHIDQIKGFQQNTINQILGFVDDNLKELTLILIEELIKRNNYILTLEKITLKNKK